MRTLRWAGRPSSSTPKVPHSDAHGAVVHQGHQRAGHLLADHAGVDRRVLDDVVGLEPVAARLVEEDPAAAPGQDHRQLTGRCRPGRQLGEGPLGGQLGQLLHRHLVEHLEPERAGCRLEAGLQPGVPDGHAGHGEAGAGLLGHRPAGPSELAIRTWRRELPHAAWTWEMASPDARAASSARRRSSRVSPFDASGPGRRAATSDRCPRAPAARRPPSRVPPAPLRATAEAASAARSRPSSVRSAVWAKPVVSPDDHPDAGPPLPPRGELLHPPVVEHGRRGRPVLGEHLGEVTAVPQGLGQHPLENWGFDHQGLLARQPPGARWPTSAVSRIVPAWRHTPVCPPESNCR